MTLPLAADAALFLADFGETVVYRPRSGAARTIVAVVERNPPEALAGAPGGATAGLVIHVRNDAALGISSAEVDLGGDKVDLALRIGLAAQARSIARIVSQDAGVLVLEVN